jgi:myo-inositol-1(or 4)-monophosphatase
MNKVLSPKDVEQRAFAVAIGAAIKAGRHVLKYWPNPLNSDFDKDLVMEVFKKEKGVGNYATIADIESEKIIIQEIQNDSLLKSHQIIAEESDDVVTESEYQWVIDPIDGTIIFKNGLPEFGVSIGLLKGGEPIMGVIAMPVLGQLIAARKGKGAKLYSFNGDVLKNLGSPSGDTSLNEKLIAYDLGYERRAVQIEKTIKKLADRVGYVPSYGSVSTGNFRLAQGLLGAFIHPRPTKMDIAAAAVIIPEVGGVVTTMRGDSIDWGADNRTYVGAISMEVHKELIKILNS